jgi:hypothetical protein
VEVLQKAVHIAEREDARGSGQVKLRDELGYQRATEYLKIAIQRIENL